MHNKLLNCVLGISTQEGGGIMLVGITKWNLSIFRQYVRCVSGNKQATDSSQQLAIVPAAVVIRFQQHTLLDHMLSSLIQL